MSRKVTDSRIMHGKHHDSISERVVEELLVFVFGNSNVCPQYTSERYPFLCDFYIKPLDLYIELNLYWTHGGHFF